jgi:hypothetical protein
MYSVSDNLEQLKDLRHHDAQLVLGPCNLQIVARGSHPYTSGQENP